MEIQVTGSFPTGVLDYITTLVVVWFSGMNCTRSSQQEKDFVRSLGARMARHWGFARVKLACIPPPRVRQPNGTLVRMWAEYTPQNGETYAGTSNVEGVLDWMNQTCGVHYRAADTLVARGVMFVFCGISNGCVPAFEFAQHYATSCHACVLVNGCPAASTTQRVSTPLPFPTIFFVADGETYFARGRGEYLSAFALRGAVIPFRGRHSSLPSVLRTWRAVKSVLIG